MMKYSLNTEAIHNLFRICQRLIAICCCFRMFSSVAGVFFGGVPLVEKYAYIGEAVELVSNINSQYEDPTLYGENGTYLTSWKGNTSQPSDCQYEGKFHMDDKRNIWLLRVEREDAEKYSVKFGAKHKRHEVHIRLTVKEECPDVPKEGSHDSIIGLLITIMILVIIILVILIIIIVLMYKSLTEFLVKGFLKLHPDFVKKNDENISKVQRPSKTTVPISPRNNVTDSNESVKSLKPYNFSDGTQCSSSSDEQNSKEITKNTAGKMKSSDSESSDEREVFLHEKHVDQIV